MMNREAHPHPATPAPRGPSHAAAGPRRPAFTLIEVLLVIGIIGFLLSILLPALASTRERAKETQGLSNLRQTGVTFAAYANEFKSWPFRAKGTRLDPDADAPNVAPNPHVLLVRWWPEGVTIGISDHWAHSWIWPGIVSRVATWPENFPLWVSPGRSVQLPDTPGSPEELENTVSVRYSHTFVARPELFRPNAQADENLLAATRPDEVQFPSRKVMLWDSHVAYIRKQPQRVGEHLAAKAPMTFADLHAELRDPTQARAGVPNPLRLGIASPINTTPDGVRGFDF
jgi:prepilin-type N-terminal cleavage/methylation domain-containing protein